MAEALTQSVKFTHDEEWMLETAVRNYKNFGDPQYGVERKRTRPTEKYKKILTDIISAPYEILLARYANEKAWTFKRDFSITSDFARIPDIIHPSPETRWGITYTLRDTSTHINAPIVYKLRYSKNGIPSNTETISMVSFRIDMKRKIILIEQAQGSSTSKPPSPDGYAARKLFKRAMPEFALYDAVRVLARRLGIEYIGVRKGIRSIDLLVRAKADEPDKS